MGQRHTDLTVLIQVDCFPLNFIMDARIMRSCLPLIFEHLRGMFEMNCLFLSGDFKFQVSPKVLILCPRSTPRG